MLSLTSILQRGISNTLLLLRVRKQHPGCLIDSVRVAPDVKLAENVRLAHDVEIRSNTSIGRWTYIEPYTFVSGGG